MKERLITGLLAGLTGAAIGAVAGLVLMEESFPVYIFLGFTITFGFIGFFAKEDWRESIADWFLDRFTP